MMMLTLHDECDFRWPSSEETTEESTSQFAAFFVCDSSSASRSLSDKAEVPVVGCAPHRLSLLAAESWVGPKEKVSKSGEVTATVSERRRIVTKVDKLDWVNYCQQ